MVADEGMRANFVKNAVDFVKKHRFDGLGILNIKIKKELCFIYFKF